MSWVRKILLFASIVLPVALMALLSYFQIRQNTIERILDERRSLATLSAHVLKAKVDHLRDLGLSVAARSSVRQLIAEQKWEAAMAELTQMSRSLPYIDRVFVADTTGTLMTDVPSTPAKKGRSYAQTDVYKEFMKTRQPYLSEVYKRLAPPHERVSALILPIKNEAGKMLGIFAVQINIAALMEWRKEVTVGNSGFVYVVDQKGHIAVNPEYAETDSIVDYSSVPAVQKALSGEKNVEILYNPIARENRVSAYEQIAGYGWAVIVQQEESAALAEGNSLRFIAIIYLVVILAVFVLAWFITREMDLRKKTEKQLEEFGHFFNNNNDLCGIANTVGYFETINTNFIKVLGYSEKEFCEMPFIALVHPDDVASTRHEYERLKAGELIINFINRYRKKDGSYLYLDWNATPNPLTGKLYCVARDITERKNAETALKASEAQRQTIFRYAPEAVVVIDEEGRIVQWNPMAEAIFGWQSAEVIGKYLHEIIIPHQFREAHVKGLGQFLKAGEGQVLNRQLELPVLRRDNTEFDAGISIAPTLVNDKYVFIGFISDITERKKAHEALNKLNVELEQRVNDRTEEVIKSAKRFKALIENSYDIIALLNEKFEPVYLSPSAERYTGWTAEEGKHINTIEQTHPDDVELRKRFRQQVLQNPAKAFSIAFRIRHKNGHYIWMEGTAMNRLHDPSVGGIITNFRDVTERKKAEEKLAHERALLRTLIDNIPDYIYVKDTQSRHLINNKANVELLGALTEETTIGKTVSDFIGTDMASDYLKDDQLVFNSGKPLINHEETIISKTGEQKYLLTTKVPLRDDKNSIIGLVGISRDITWQKQIELDLREKKYFLEKAQEIGQIGYWISEIDIGKLTWSDETCRIFGIAPLEFDGQRKTFFDFVHPDDLEKYTAASSYAVENHETYRIEHRIVLRDGIIKWVFQQGEASRDKNGKSIIVGIVQDITERKKTEDALVHSEARARRLFESDLIGFIFWSDTGEILEANDYFLSMTGYTRYDLENGLVNWAAMTPPEYADRDVIALEQIASTGYCKPFEKEYIRKDGSRFPISLGATSLGDSFNGFGVCYVMDISERKKAEEDIKSLNQRLEKKVDERTSQWQRANKELEAFSYSVSHDLRTPLRAIDGYARILEEDYAGKLDVDGKKVIATISRNALRMGQLIDDMLNFSRYGRLELSLVTINMTDIVERILNELLIHEKDRVIKTNVAKLNNAQGDIDMLRQVWINYISNALKYSAKRKETEITISSRVANGEIWYYIKDNGAGFDNQYAHKLFLVFQRLHKESEFDGTGVGLATCKRIIERHGGRVWAEGEPGKGATFYFSLPTS